MQNRSLYKSRFYPIVCLLMKQNKFEKASVNRRKVEEKEEPKRKIDNNMPGIRTVFLA